MTTRTAPLNGFTLAALVSRSNLEDGGTAQTVGLHSSAVKSNSSLVVRQELLLMSLTVLVAVAEGVLARTPRRARP